MTKLGKGETGNHRLGVLGVLSFLEPQRSAPDAYSLINAYSDSGSAKCHIIVAVINWIKNTVIFTIFCFIDKYFCNRDC